MKKVFVFLLLLITIFVPATLGFAHSGKTDENGGHYDRNTGEYHYHHGYSAHQHPNGVCPLEDWDTEEETTKKHTTTRKSTTTTKYQRSTTTTKESLADELEDMPWYFWALVGVTVLWTIPITFYVIYDDIARKKR